MSGIPWLGSLDAAMSAARDGDKLVLLDIFSPT
jgi:hypothetical protein